MFGTSDTGGGQDRFSFVRTPGERQETEGRKRKHTRNNVYGRNKTRRRSEEDDKNFCGRPEHNSYTNNTDGTDARVVTGVFVRVVKTYDLFG